MDFQTLYQRELGRQKDEKDASESVSLREQKTSLKRILEIAGVSVAVVGAFLMGAEIAEKGNAVARENTAAVNKMAYDMRNEYFLKANTASRDAKQPSKK